MKSLSRHNNTNTAHWHGLCAGAQRKKPRRKAGFLYLSTESDCGCQYTSYAFGKRCQEMGVMPSTGGIGDAYGNAMAERFFATLEREVLNRRRFMTQAEARMAIFEWL